MSVVVADTLSAFEASELRRRIRGVLQSEHVRLRAERQALLALLESMALEPGDELHVLFNKVDVINRRISAIQGHFAATAATTPDATSSLDRVMCVDLGDGPGLVLLSEIGAPDTQVIAARSPLGRALAAAQAGDVVVYDTAGGPAEAVVLAAEPAVAMHLPGAETGTDVASHEI
jgi:hypothetical protein